MVACLLVVYWPDFKEDGLSPALVASCTARCLAVRFARFAGAACVPSEDAPAQAAFRRWGLEVRAGGNVVETTRQLLVAHPEAERLVLAMDPARADEVFAGVEAALPAVEIWAPSGRGVHSGPDVRPLAEVLHLGTAQPVGLFVEGRALDAAAGDRGDLQVPATGLLRAAELAGSVVTARWYFPGCCVDLAGTVPDPMLPPRGGPHAESVSASSQLQADLRELLEDRHAPRTWILVSDSAWCADVALRARERGIRTLLWLPDGAALRPELRAEFDFSCFLSKLPVRPASRRGAGGRPAIEPEGVVVRETVLPEIPIAGARLCPWVRLIYHTECALRQSRTARLPVRKLAAVLAELEEFGPTPANAMTWINRARAAGILSLEPEWHRGEPGARVTVCRTNSEHALVRAAVDVPDRCLRLLHQMLQKIPWVSFKLLRNVLLREQWLGGPPHQLDGAGIDEWLNFLIHDHAIRMTKEPNLVNPDYPVTALRLNHDHPLSRSVVAEAVEGTRLAAERAILAVDHFMIRNQKPWMAMGALRRTLETMGREELQAVLQGLQNLGALVTESYPNPQKEHSTTGCRLKPDEPIVVEALNIRNLIIRVTRAHQNSRNWVSLSQVVEDLNRFCDGAIPSHSYRLAWFLLLRDEGILELDHDGHLPGTGWENIRCRLNLSDAVVRAAIGESDPEVANRADEAERSRVPVTSEAWAAGR